MRDGHLFNLIGGDQLTTMGATWFVSFCYYQHVNKNHFNWNMVSTVQNRKSVYFHSYEYHKYWLNEVLKMSDSNLNRNSIGLIATQVKQMAREILNKS